MPINNPKGFHLHHALFCFSPRSIRLVIDNLKEERKKVTTKSHGSFKFLVLPASREAPARQHTSALDDVFSSVVNPNFHKNEQTCLPV
jgi:hypothetical protein